ncbi:MAG: hypothetical protein ABSB15_06835 [Bryobacteraceae bacterium]|jgi:hypothetical protein
MLTAGHIRELFAALNGELERRNIRGEVYLAGGAVMCLVFQARPATKDIDALLVPPGELREAALAVARRESLPDDWLNDAVKGYFSENGRFEVFEEMSRLRVYVPHPGYLLAMKCLALRLGEEFQDLEDVKVLIRALGLRTVDEAQSLLGLYYPLDRYPAKARYVLEELIGGIEGETK